MKQFFKFMLASMTGFIALIFLFFILLIIISAFQDKDVVINDNSILRITLDEPLTERTSKNPAEKLKFLTGSFSTQPGLNDILSCIKKAAADNKIRGIFLNTSSVSGGFASIEEIRNALVDFKLKSKKFVYAYGESYSQGAYYLASVADKIILNPVGEVDFKGLRAELMFFKGTLEKLEIEPEVIRHGKFKSAVEPYTLDKMSDENRKQLGSLIDDLWEHFLLRISESRKISKEQLENIANGLLVKNAKEAVQQKLVDQLGYEDEVMSELKRKTGVDEKSELSFVGLKNYNKVPEIKKEKFTMDRIAVVYATGEIISGKSTKEKMGSETISEAIRKAGSDDHVKAIVLRVNSPGGSALASDVIWREVVLAKKVKPVIVSMGDVAASGGYYISCIADTIVAQPNTITGSIGVFGLLLNAKGLLNNKLGITVDTYKTNPYADIGTTSRPLTEAERAVLQAGVEKVYDTFTGRVAEGRHMKQSDVDSIGQGRVWSATDAKEIGLVDVLGGIDDAIKIAAAKVKLNNYRILALPEQHESLLNSLLEDMDDDVSTYYAKKKMGASYSLYQSATDILSHNGIQAWFPFQLNFNQ